MTDRRRITAYHEAAHVVIQYRANGHGGQVTIVPDRANKTLGTASDHGSDSSCEEEVIGVILSCFAGGHAQRKLEPASGADGCADDEEIAAKYLSSGFGDREAELRLKSLEMVLAHWSEIEAVAEELLRVETLDETEVELIADGEDPASYRALAGRTPS